MLTEVCLAAGPEQWEYSHLCGRKTDVSSGKKNLYFVHATNCPLTVVASYADTIKLPSMGAAREVSLYKTMEHFLVAGVITCHRNLEFDKLT